MKWIVTRHDDGDDKWVVEEFRNGPDARSRYESIKIIGSVGQPDKKMIASLIEEHGL
jgi:hypothetical protein